MQTYRYSRLLLFPVDAFVDRENNSAHRSECVTGDSRCVVDHAATPGGPPNPGGMRMHDLRSHFGRGICFAIASSAGVYSKYGFVAKVVPHVSKKQGCLSWTFAIEQVVEFAQFLNQRNHVRTIVISSSLTWSILNDSARLVD